MNRLNSILDITKEKFGKMKDQKDTQRLEMIQNTGSVSESCVDMMKMSSLYIIEFLD